MMHPSTLTALSALCVTSFYKVCHSYGPLRPLRPLLNVVSFGCPTDSSQTDADNMAFHLSATLWSSRPGRTPLLILVLHSSETLRFLNARQIKHLLIYQLTTNWEARCRRVRSMIDDPSLGHYYYPSNELGIDWLSPKNSRS